MIRVGLISRVFFAAMSLCAAADWERPALAENDPRLTAEVVLASPRPDISGPITSENVRERLPLPDQVARAQSGFTRLGFACGPAGGVGFSISAAKSVFEQVFQVRIAVAPDGSARLAWGWASSPYR